MLVMIELNSYSQVEDHNWFFGGRFDNRFLTRQSPIAPLAGLNFNLLQVVSLFSDNLYFFVLI